MGWSYTHRPKGYSNLEWFRDHEGWPEGSGYELLDMATKNGVAYGALRLPDGNIMALVYLVRWAPHDPYNFGHKAMSEEMGPYYFDCPARILDQLTPPVNDEAREWRAKCREQLAAREARPKVSQGMHVRFKDQLTFTDGRKHSLFEWTGGNTFRFVYEHGTGGRATIRKWRELPYALA